MFKDLDEFQINLLNIEDYSENSKSRLRFWFKHIKENALNDDGDIFEFGVFRGSSLIAAAIILKEMGSKKKIFGFDSFEGFPCYSEKDDLENFYKYKGKIFDEKFINKFEKFKELKKMITGLDNFDKISIASSGNFSQTSYEDIKNKIEYLKLDNIKIIKGPFSETVKEFFEKDNYKISSANLDCDLYEGYKICLPIIYNYLSKSGFIHLDEYYSFKYPGAKIACDEFFKEQNIKPLKNKTRKNEFERWYITK